MLVVAMVGVCFEIGLEAPSFPEKERVSWPLQTPTPNSTASTWREGATIHRLDLTQGRGVDNWVV